MTFLASLESWGQIRCESLQDAGLPRLLIYMKRVAKEAGYCHFGHENNFE